MQAAEAVREKRGKRGVSLQRVRRWLLACTLVLAAIVAGFIGYARQRARKSLRELPHLLGADIRSVTDGFTYSQTVRGRTLFTVHAAKAIQRENGKTTLHNVSVTLYGEPGSNRTDSIRGAEFEYDQPNGVIRAMGETELDLASPVSGNAPQPNAKRITIHASGLVFLEKLGVAATEDQVRFQYGTLHGHSHGADYDADTGLLRLHHDVHLQSEENGHLEMVDADDAVLDRQKRTALLHHAALEDAGDRLRAQTLQLDLRPEGTVHAGSLQQAHADGNVELDSSQGARIRGQHLLASFSESNRPHDAVLTGGVELVDASATGSAAEARATFTAQGRPQHVDLLRSASLHIKGDRPGASRDLTADKVSGDLIHPRAQHGSPRNLVATGNARLQIIDPFKASSSEGGSSRSENRGSDTTVVTAATLRAFGEDGIGGHWQLRRMEGEGATRLEQHTSDGGERSSNGDHLLVLFGPEAARGSGGSGTTEAVQSLIQQGHVAITDRRPAQTQSIGVKPRDTSTAALSHATAERVEYTGTTGKAVLTGNPVVNDTGTQIVADRITLSRLTGDAEAQGRVRGSYASNTTGAALRPAAAPPEPTTGSRDAGPVHFLADRASLQRTSQTATLYGGSVPARLWNNSAQLEAPVIDLVRTDGSIHAHAAVSRAAAGAGTGLVRAVLPAGPMSAQKIQAAGTAPIRVLSSDAVYTQSASAARAQAHFSGGVRMLAPDGTVSAQEATALFQPSSGSGPQGGLGAGSVQQVIAQGSVSIQQPGRTAAGDRLVYTAATQQYQLTGTAAAPPVVRDTVQGTVTGALLIFHSGDDSVEVEGAKNGTVHTDALVPERKSQGKPKLTPARKVPGHTP